MNIILNTEKSYKLSELALAVTNSNDDLIYIEKQIDGKSVSIAVSREKFLEGITGGSTGKYIVSGGATWTGTGLVFDVSNIVFNYFGNEGTASATQVTLDDGDSDPRFDVIVVDEDGNIEVVKGTPAVSPAIPSVGEDQISIQPVLIAAGATVPTITQEFVYRNDAEWTTSTYGSGTGSIDFQSTDDPYEGTFCIKADVTSGIGNRFVIGAGDIDLSTYTQLTFFIRFDTALPAGKSLLSSVWNNGSTVGSTVNFMPYGIDRNDTGVWQQITVPTSQFNAGTIDRIQIRMDGAGGQVEYFLDYIVFSTGASPGVSLPDIITIQDGGTSIGARPKLNFIEGTNVTLDIVDDPVNDRVNVTINSTAGGGGIVQSVVGGTDISVDSSDPANPVVSYNGTPGGQVDSVVGTAEEIDVDNSDPANPVASLATEVKDSLALADSASQPGQNVSQFSNDAGYLTSAPVDSVNGETGVVVLGEKDIDGDTDENLTVTGATNISLTDHVDQYLTLTGNATITFTDTPASGETIVRSYLVESTAAETLGIANSTQEQGTYAADGSLNRMIVVASNYSTQGLFIVVTFEQFN